MSIIHKALKRADPSDQIHTKSAYNPLSSHKKNKAIQTYAYAIFGIICVTGAIGIVTWQPTNVAPMLPNVEPTSVATEQNTSSEDSLISPPQDTAELSTATKNSETVTVDAPEVIALAPAQAETPTPAVSVPRTEAITTETTPTVIKKLAVAAKTEKPIIQPVVKKTLKTQDKVTGPTEKTSADEPKPIKKVQVSIIKASQNQWQHQVETYIENEELEQAEAVLKQWIGAAPTDEVPRIWLARIYINNRFYQAAEPLLEPLKTIDARALLGVVYERTNRPQSAANQFEALFREQPENGRWLLFWAINGENSGQLEKSHTLYQNYVTLFPQEEPTLVAFAQQRLSTLRQRP